MMLLALLLLQTGVTGMHTTTITVDPDVTSLHEARDQVRAHQAAQRDGKNGFESVTVKLLPGLHNVGKCNCAVD